MKVGEVRQYEVKDKIIKNAICPKCRNCFDANMHSVIQAGKVYFIPISKFTVLRYIMCPHCATQYEFTKSEYELIIKSNHPQDILYDKCEGYLSGERKKSENYVSNSDKSMLIAFILSFFLGIAGAQNWYLGHVKRALVSLFLDLLSIILIISMSIMGVDSQIASIPLAVSAVFLAFNAYWGIFYSIMIILGHSKDSTGKYLMSRKQYENRMKKYHSLY